MKRLGMNVERSLSAESLQPLISWLEQTWQDVNGGAPPPPHPGRKRSPSGPFEVWLGLLVTTWRDHRDAELQYQKKPLENKELLSLISEGWCVRSALWPQLVVVWLWARGLDEATTDRDLQGPAKLISYSSTQLKNYLRSASRARKTLLFDVPSIWRLRSPPAGPERVRAPVSAAAGAFFDDMLPSRPDLFYGRARDVAEIKERLGVAGTSREEALRTQAITAIRGIGGIGKSTLVARLSWDEEVRRVFPEGILFVSLGREPNIEAQLGKLGRRLGHEAIEREEIRGAQVRALAALFGDRRALVILDDVWEAEHAAPFKQALGRGAVVLIATRKEAVAGELVATAGAIHRLDPLDPPDALEMLSYLAPSIVAAQRSDCEDLLREIGYLPLAIRVAGPLLVAEERLGWGVDHLMKSLREGHGLLSARAPHDYESDDWSHSPTVGSILRRSVDHLSPAARDCFTRLAAFPPKPYAFAHDDVGELLVLPDPRDLLRELVQQGLIEPLGDARFQVHPVLSALARSLRNEVL